MGFLSAAIVKKFEFHKSKMADGGRFENRYIRDFTISAIF